MLPQRTPTQAEQEAEARLRRLLTSNDLSALEEPIGGTTLFGNIRARCHCNRCDSKQVHSGPRKWSSLIGLTGECFECHEYPAPIKMVFSDSNGNVILVIHPEVSREHLLQGLCYLEQYSRIPVIAPTGSAFTMVRTSSGGYFYTVGTLTLASASTQLNANAGSATLPAGAEPAGASAAAVTAATRPLQGRNTQALVEAIKNDVISDIEQLITAQNIDDVITQGLTALCYACYWGNAGKVEVVKWLLAKGANPNAPSKDMLMPLHTAAGATIENEEVVRLLLDHKDRDGNPNGANVNATDSVGLSPLHNACTAGHVATAILLIKHGANVSKEANAKNTPLHFAARRDKVEMVKVLLEAGAPVDALDNMDRTPLCNAIYSGKQFVSRALLAGGANVDLVRPELRSPEWAGGESARLLTKQTQVNREPRPQVASIPPRATVMRGAYRIDERISILEALNKQQIEIETKLAATLKKNKILQDQLSHMNQELAEKVTLLHKTQQHNTDLEQKKTDCYERLLRPSDSVCTRVRASSECSVYTVPTYAPPAVSSVAAVQAATRPHQGGSHYELYRAIQNGNDISPFITLNNIDDEIYEGQTALCLACHLGKVEIVKWLLAQGANVHGRSKHGTTPLHAAASAESVEVVCLLLDHKDRNGNLNGADVNDIDSDGSTPLHASCSRGQWDISALLIERRANVNAVTYSINNTPLHLAAREGHTEVVKLLLLKGASVDCLNNCDMTPLYAAIYHNREFAGRVLLASGAEVGKVHLPISSWVTQAVAEMRANRAQEIRVEQHQFAASTQTANRTVAVMSSEQKEMKLRILEARNKRDEDAQTRPQTYAKLTAAQSNNAKLQNQWWFANQQLLEKAAELEKTLHHNIALQQETENLKQRLLALEELTRSFPWQQYADEAAACDSVEVKQKLDAWRAVQLEFSQSEEALTRADESLLMNDQFVEKVKHRYAILGRLLQLTPDVLEDCRQGVESVRLLEECVTRYAAASVADAEWALYEKVQLLTTSHDEVASKYQALQAAQQREALQAVKSVRGKLLEEVSHACQRHQGLADFREEASRTLSPLLELYLSLKQARQSLQHAREMLRQFPKTIKYKEKAEKRNAAYLDQCEKYRHIQEQRIRPLRKMGFVEFKPFLGAEMNEYVIESRGGVISKARHGEIEVALKRGPRDEVERELHVLTRLNHPYVISAVSIAYLSPLEAMLVLPWINGLTLDVWLEKMKPSDAEMRELFRDIIDGLAHVHANSIVHGKISPEVIMVDLVGPRICDFSHSEDPTFISGFAAVDEEKTLDVYHPHGEAKSQALDIYALAVCLFKAYFKRDPFFVDNESYPVMPDTYLPGLLHLLKGMLNPSPEKRPTASGLSVQFSFFKSSVETYTQDRIKAFRASMALLFIDEPDVELLKFAKKNFINEVAGTLLSTQKYLNLKFEVIFEDEDGIDGGALTIAMYERFLKEVSSPAFGLFEAGHGGKLLPCKLTKLSEEQQRILQAYGVALARIIINGYAINVPLASIFYQYLRDDLLNQKTKVTMDHLENFDNQESQNIVRLLSPSTTDYSLYNFDDIPEAPRAVTRINVHEYVNKWIQANLIDTRMVALSAISQGFKCFGEVINQHIAVLSPQDIQLLVCGENLPASALIERLQFEGFHEDDSTPTFLKNVISKMTTADLTVFLHFVIAQETLPITSDKVIEITRRSSSQHMLPEAHTCFWQLVLASYSSEEDLRRDLMMAIHETRSVFTLH